MTTEPLHMSMGSTQSHNVSIKLKNINMKLACEINDFHSTPKP